MKKIVAVLLLMIASFNLHAQEKKSAKHVIKTNIVCEHCKVCETCGLSFKANLMKISGLKMYELDEENQTITVYYSTKKTSIDEIRTTISKLGFDADDVKADPEAYAKLDACCKA